MGADLFGSYVATILATMVLGQEVVSDDAFGGTAPILLPMLIAGIGIIFSLVGTLFVRIKNDSGNVQGALNMGNWISIILTGVAAVFLTKYLLPDSMVIRGFEMTDTDVVFSIITGLVVGALMSIVTEYYTAMGRRPVKIDSTAVLDRTCHQHHRRSVRRHGIHGGSYRNTGCRNILLV